MTKTLFSTTLALSFGPLVMSQPAMAQDWAREEGVGRTHLAVSGPLTLVEGEAFWGGYLELLHDVTSSFAFGGGTGFQFWSRSANSTLGNASSNAWIIPILLKGIYKFDFPQAPTFKPFIGVSLGAGITHAGIELGPLSGSGTTTQFEGLASLGAYFGFEQTVFIEMRLGAVGSNFIFAPSLGVQF